MLKKLLLLATALALSSSLATAQTQQYSGYPSNSVPLIAASANTPAGIITLTFAARVGWRNYLQHITCTGGGATAGSNIVAAITGLDVDGVATQPSFILSPPTGATVGMPRFDVAYDPPLPATAANTAIVLTVPSFGAGNTHAMCSMTGFQITSG